MDTVRADHVYGYGGRATPAIAEIVREGAVFRHSYAASSYTIPSHMSMFTGLDPAQHGVSRMNARLNPKVPTLASLLRDAGYRTQAFTEGGFVHPRFGFDRGFDKYEMLRGSLVDHEATHQVTDWMESMGDEPYFLFLHTYAAHFPYGGYEGYRLANPERHLPSRDQLAMRSEIVKQGGSDPELNYLCTLYIQLAPTRDRDLGCGENRPTIAFSKQPHFEADIAAIRRGYNERVRRVDNAVGVIRDALIRLGQWEDTLFVVTSDHGDAFYEHDLYRHAFVPFNEVMRVPLVVSYPRLLAASSPKVIDGVVSHLDLLPTILGLAQVTPPKGLLGMDLGPMLDGTQEIDVNRRIFPAALRAAQLDQVPLRRILIERHRKLIEGHELFGDAEGFLFHLDIDRDELNNLREEEPEEFEALSRAAEAYDAMLVRIDPVDQTTGEPLAAEIFDAPSFQPLSAEEQEHLRALGYGN